MASFKTAAEFLPEWKAAIENGDKPVTFPIGKEGFNPVRIGPKRVVLMGGPPGLGKTSLVMQWVFDALRATPELRAVVCNVEMGAEALLDRQLSRLGYIDLTHIEERERALIPDENLAFGINAIAEIADRLAFVEGQPTLERIVSAAEEFRAGLIVCDYLQRIPVSEASASESRTVSVSQSMDYLRKVAATGRAVFAISGLTRGKDNKGNSTYANAGLASFRDSAELEYGADVAYLLKADGEPDDEGVLPVNLECVKNRYGRLASLYLHFDRPHQEFTVTERIEVIHESPPILTSIWDDPPAKEAENE